MSVESPLQPTQFPRMVYFIATLTISMVASFLISIVLLYFFAIPPSNRETLVYMLGQLSGLTSGCVLFWVNSNHQSGIKTDLLSKAEPVKP